MSWKITFVYFDPTTTNHDHHSRKLYTCLPRSLLIRNLDGPYKMTESEGSEQTVSK